jgi:hypothetical protein
MKRARRWLLYKMIKKPDGKASKVPYYVNGKPRNGMLDTPDDVRQLVDYETAAQVVDGSDAYAGLGFALGKDGDGFWQGIDVDNYQENNLENLVKQLPGYVEHSPSGTGVHAIGYGEFFNGQNEGNGIEYYSSGRYFTFTGKAIRSSGMTDLKPFIKTKINPNLRDKLPSEKQERGYLIQTPEQLEEIRTALTFIDADCDYHRWKQVLFSLHRIEGGVEMWAQWSITAKEPHNRSTYDSRVKEGYASLQTYRGDVNIGTLFMYAMEGGYKSNSATAQILETKDESRAQDYAELFKFVDVNYQRLTEPDWVIDGFIGEGITMIAGATGRGKSSSIVPLTLNVAHLTEPNFLTPRHRRKVIYLTEDSNQVQRLVYGMKRHHSRAFKFPDDEWNDWFKIINTHRMSATAICYLAEMCAEHITNVDGKEIPPLVVFDTASASFSIDEENNNSEAARAISIVKTEFWVKRFIPVWIAGHTSKANNREQMIEHMSARGANAWEADVNGTAYIFEDENLEGRIFATGKRRFDPAITEVRAVLNKHKAEAVNRYGEVNHNANYYTAEFIESSAEDRQNMREEGRQNDADNQVAQAVFNLEKNGHPITKQDIRKESGLGHGRFSSALQNLERTGTVIVYSITDPAVRKQYGLNNNEKIFYRLKETWIPR